MAKEISIREVIECLNLGYTRTKSSNGYDPNIGSIEEKYGLSSFEVKEMFTHPLLANRKTRKAPSFILVEDYDQEDAPVKGYGVRTIKPQQKQVELQLDTPQQSDLAVVDTIEVSNENIQNLEAVAVETSSIPLAQEEGVF